MRQWLYVICISGATAALILLPRPSAAHLEAAQVAPPGLGSAWTLDPLLVLPLALATVMYLVGLCRYWRKAGAGRGVQIRQAAMHLLGLLALWTALVWPLDVLGEWSLAAHMAQHMLLLSLAAPLLVIGRPGVVWLSALPKRWARTLTRFAKKLARRPAVTSLRGPGVAMLLQAAVLWGWHAPAAMQLALTRDAVHYAMHATFLAAGLWFWMSLRGKLRETRAAFGGGAVALFGALIATMIQMGLLSALLTFAPTPRFAWYVGRSEALGLTPLEDQQLAGLIMWVPGALPYLLGSLMLAAAWLRRSERIDARRERQHSR